MADDARGPRRTEVVWQTLVGYGQVAARRLPEGSNTDPFRLADTPWRYLEPASSITVATECSGCRDTLAPRK